MEQGPQNLGYCKIDLRDQILFQLTWGIFYIAYIRIPFHQPGIHGSQQSVVESWSALGSNDSSTALGLLVEHGCVLESYGQVLLSWKGL